MAQARGDLPVTECWVPPGVVGVPGDTCGHRDWGVLGIVWAGLRGAAQDGPHGESSLGVEGETQGRR